MGRILIIAEAGVNHNGDMGLAKELVMKAAEAGADAVKFQTFIPEQMVSKFAEKAVYQKRTDMHNENQLEMLKRLVLSEENHYELKKLSESVGIMFLSTPFDLESIDLLKRVGIPLFKIPSGEITNLPYLEKIGKAGMKVIMSTGMAEIEEIDNAIDILKKNGVSDISLLHCNTEYPTPYKDVNLLAMGELKRRFGVPVGYSDHTDGIEVPIAAAALGAEIIEKHITLDRNMEGPDHRASLEIGELERMVNAVRNVELARGDGIKRRTTSELHNVNVVRKSIVAKRNIEKGEIFAESNIAVKRPGNGISPMNWYEVIGKTASRNFLEDELIEL